MAQGSLNDMLKNLRSNGELPATAPVAAPPSGLAQAVLNPPADTPPLFGAAPAAPAAPATDPLAFFKKVQAAPVAATPVVATPVVATPVAAAPAAPAADPLAFLKKIQATAQAEPAVPAVETPPAPVVATPVVATPVVATPAPPTIAVLPPPEVATAPTVDYQVVPPDAPQADLTATEPEENKKRGRPKGGKRAAKEDVLQAGGEKLVEVLERIATALEKIASRE